MTIYTELLAELNLDQLKEIKGYSRYLVDLKRGRIFNKLRNKWIVSNPNHLGYCYASLQSDNGEYTVKGVHQWVMIAALDGFDFPKLGLEVDHRNCEDRSNNSFTNLQLLSRTQNLAKRKNMKPIKRLNQDEVNELRNDFKKAELKHGEKMKWYEEYAEKYDVCLSTIQTTILEYYNKDIA